MVNFTLTQAYLATLGAPPVEEQAAPQEAQPLEEQPTPLQAEPTPQEAQPREEQPTVQGDEAMEQAYWERWSDDGWVPGYKVWVGDLPEGLQKHELVHALKAYGSPLDVNIVRHKAKSGMVLAVATFGYLEEAERTLRDLPYVQFKHPKQGDKLMVPTVAWYTSTKKGSSTARGSGD